MPYGNFIHFWEQSTIFIVLFNILSASKLYIKQVDSNKLHSFQNPGSFDTLLCIHSAEWTFRLLNQAGRNYYPCHPKFVGNTRNQTSDLNSGLTVDKCISNKRLYHLSHSAT